MEQSQRGSIVKLLVILAFICALVVTVIGVGWWDEQAEHVFGWLGGCLSFYLLAKLI